MLDVPWGDLLPFLVFGIVVADASVAIRADMGGYESDLRKAEKTTQTWGERIKNLLTPKGLLMAGGLFGLGQSIPTLTRQMVGFLGDSAAAFSELEQTQRTVDEVFGNSARVIEDWAKRSADSAGMSQRTVFKAASVMGQTLLNMGYNAAEAAEQVVILQQRAAEMAISVGETPERAILAITAAMRGERDTIEKFGVSIKQTDVNARVMALGLDTSTAAALKNSEAMAILDLIMEQTGKRADRFAESQDDVAVKMAQTNARWDDFMTTQLGPTIASIQLGAFKAADATTDYLDTAGGNIAEFALNFGQQRGQIMALADKFGMDFEDLRDRIANAMDLTGLSASEIILTLEGADTVEQGFINLIDGSTSARNAVATNMGGVPSTIRANIEETGRATAELAQRMVDEMKARWQDSRDAGAAMVAAYNLGIFESQDSLNSEVDALLAALDERLTPGEEMARIRGQLMQLQLARGVQEDLGDEGAVAAIDELIRKLRAQLNGLNGYGYGRNLVLTLADGIYANLGSASLASYALANRIRTPVFIQSEPKDPNSPLRGITKIGGNIVDTIAGGIFANLGTGSDAAAALAGALVPSFGYAGAAMGGGMGMAGETRIYQLYVDGKPKSVGDTADALRAFDQMEQF